MLDPHQVGEAGHESAGVVRLHHEVGLLVPPGDLALVVDAPHVHVAPLEADLRVGDAHLGGPAERVARDARVPHAVPGVAVPVVVVERAVVERARGVHPEVEAAPAVMVGVDVDGKPVGAHDAVPPGEQRHDGVGRRVVEPRADVQRVVVVEEPDLGPLRRGVALARYPLGEPGGRLRLHPGGIVEPAVERRSARPAGRRGPRRLRWQANRREPPPGRRRAARRSAAWRRAGR